MRSLAAIAALIVVVATLWSLSRTVARHEVAAAPTGAIHPVRGIPLREPVVPGAPERLRAGVAVADAAPSQPAARSCPDLEAVVARTAENVLERTRSVVRDWMADCALQARGFDAHCVGELVGMGADPARDPYERLAALSLVAVDPDASRGVVLDPATREWLWSCARAEAFDPVLDLEPRTYDAVQLACLALTWLGGERERALLVAGLDDPVLGGPSRYALAQARTPDVAPRLVEMLERGGLGGWNVLLILGSTGTGHGPTFTPAERTRAVQVILDALGQPRMGICGTDSGAVEHLALEALEPGGVALIWAERLDRVGFEPESARWSIGSLARRAEPADLVRLRSLVGDGPLEQRVDVATLVLQHGDGERAAPLRQECLALLCDALQPEAPKQVRVLAVRGLQRAGELGPLELAALERAALDPDRYLRSQALDALGRPAPPEPIEPLPATIELLSPSLGN